jgi:hypothetical protein
VERRRQRQMCIRDRLGCDGLGAAGRCGHLFWLLAFNGIALEILCAQIRAEGS